MLLCVVFPLCAAPGLILMFGRDTFSGGKMGYAARRGAIPGSRVEYQACWLARMCKGCSLLSDVSCSGISRGRLSLASLPLGLWPGRGREWLRLRHREWLMERRGCTSTVSLDWFPILFFFVAVFADATCLLMPERVRYLKTAHCPEPSPLGLAGPQGKYPPSAVHPNHSNE